MKRKNLIIITCLITFNCEAFNPQRTYQKKCSQCHSVKSEIAEPAPSFVALEQKRGDEWVKNYIKTSNSQEHDFSSYATNEKKLNELINFIFVAGAGTDQEIRHLKGDMKAGRVLSSSCVSCHGPSGYSSNPEVPHLRGQNGAYLIAQLKAFRDGGRIDTNGTMSSMAKSLSDRDIVNISTYYETLNND